MVGWGWTRNLRSGENQPVGWERAGLGVANRRFAGEDVQACWVSGWARLCGRRGGTPSGAVAVVGCSSRGWEKTSRLEVAKQPDWDLHRCLSFPPDGPLLPL
jgi:hypothetical protein